MKPLVRKLLFICFLSSFSLLEAQEILHFRKIDSRKGLSQNSVFAITQDGDGFMWLGTRRGLNRYDGYRMRSYEKGEGHSNNLIHDDIRALYYDSLINRLWICTLEGLSQYSPDTDDFQNFLFPPNIPSHNNGEAVRCIQRDKQGQLWVGTTQGLYRFQDSLQQFVACPSPQAEIGESTIDINAIFEDQEGTLWIGSNRGLFQLSVDSARHSYHLQRPRSVHLQEMIQMPIRVIKQDAEGQFWFGTFTEGIYRWKPSQSPIHFQQDPLNPFSIIGNDIRAVEVDPKGRIWIGTLLGLSIFDPVTQRFHRYTQDSNHPQSLGKGSVRAICFDSRGSAWLGTYYDGVSYYHPESNRFSHSQPNTKNSDLKQAVINSFWEDQKGNLWIGTGGRGLHFWNRKAGSSLQFLHQSGQGSGLSGNNVKVVLGQGDSLWIGTFASGLNLLHLPTQRWEHFEKQDSIEDGLTNNNVYSLALDQGLLYVATYGGGLHIMDTQTGKFQIYQHDEQDSTSIHSDLTRVLLKDRKGQLWIGSNGGLDRIETRPNGDRVFHHYLSGYMVCTLVEAADGTLWAGTYRQGVLAINQKGEVLHHYSPQTQLPGHAVFGVLEDENGKIWISTDQGLAKIDPEDGSIADYNHSDGLENLEYNFNACFRDQSGELFFGGTSGFTSFFPSEISTNTFVPPVVFADLYSFNQLVRPGQTEGPLRSSINEAEELVFPYDRANFTLRFSALDYLNPDNNHFAYQLEGLDQDWQYVQGQSEVSYTLQRFGSYTFRLRGGNNDGIWNPEERRLKITVLPPPWRTQTAYCLYGLLGLLLLVGTFRFVRMRHRLQLEQLAKNQQEELHQAKIRFYTNVVHEFRTPLTLILGPIEEMLGKNRSKQVKPQLKTIQHNANRLLRLVNQLLDIRSIENAHTHLQLGQGNIVAFLQKVYLSFQEQARISHIQYTFESSVPHIPLWYDRDKLEKVFYNLLSNALKFTPEGGTIRVQLLEEAEAIRVRICDSGPGIPTELHNQVFERYFQRGLGNARFPGGTGIGLALTKQLVEMHGGEIQLGASEMAGACFQVSLRKGQEHFQTTDQQVDWLEEEYVEELIEETAFVAKNSLLTDLDPSDSKGTLLIVEDNPSVREYIQNMFEPQYTILLAEHGQMGLEKALTFLPDLIISDLIMPQMDGISLCNQLKVHAETSHIPFILLTASTSPQHRLEGLETGADVYVTKPFSPYELQLKVQNLLQSKQRIRDRFQRVVKLEPREIPITPADEIFLNKAISVVEQHISDPNFTVEILAHHLAVSRPLLFTRFKSIIQQTPNNFVKSLRLKRSAQLLQHSDLRVAEVAYRVGFRDTRYFSKCFQKEFGKTPSQFRSEL